MLSHSTNDVDRIFLFLLIPIHFTDYILVSVIHKFYSFLIFFISISDKTIINMGNSGVCFDLNF